MCVCVRASAFSPTKVAWETSLVRHNNQRRLNFHTQKQQLATQQNRVVAWLGYFLLFQLKCLASEYVLLMEVSYI